MKQKKERLSVTVEAGTWKRVMKHEGEPVISLSLRWPKLPEDCAPLRRIGRYYQQMANCWRSRWEVSLYARACAELDALRERSLPFRPWEVMLDFTVTYNEQGLLSLYTEAYEYTGGAHGITMRCGDTWCLCNGMPRPLSSFFPPKSHWKRTVLVRVTESIQAALSTGEALYFDDWETSVAREFDASRFYLTQQGVTVFYPLYTLAPYAEGIPAFLVREWEKTEP